jgi:hypothetical protein
MHWPRWTEASPCLRHSTTTGGPGICWSPTNESHGRSSHRTAHGTTACSRRWRFLRCSPPVNRTRYALHSTRSGRPRSPSATDGTRCCSPRSGKAAHVVRRGLTERLVGVGHLFLGLLQRRDERAHLVQVDLIPACHPHSPRQCRAVPAVRTVTVPVAASPPGHRSSRSRPPGRQRSGSGLALRGGSWGKQGRVAFDGGFVLDVRAGVARSTGRDHRRVRERLRRLHSADLLGSSLALCPDVSLICFASLVEAGPASRMPW